MADTSESCNLLIELLESCKSRDYAGYGKFDALNSPVLNYLSFNNSLLRLLFTQAVKECPFHIRPWLGVRTSRNPKGIALFARAYLALFEVTGSEEYLHEAEVLLQWLIENRSKGRARFCWGYNFIWQSQIFYVGKYEPNAVVTVFAAEAFIHAFRVTGKPGYLEVARSAAEFLLKDLPVLFEDDRERAISYVEQRAAKPVLNTQVLTGAVFVKLYNIDRDERWLKVAIKQYEYTVNKRIHDCAWSYSFPPDRYHTVDNYHTGGILDALLDFFEETGDDRYNSLFWRGLEYYRTRLFEADGAPRWMDSKSYPHDIHGAAQGIITFVRSSYHRTEYIREAERIYSWTIASMYNKERKEFIYRRGRFITWNYTLMRWCNAWMSRAVAELVKRKTLMARGDSYDRQTIGIR